MAIDSPGISEGQPMTRTQWADNQLRAAILRGEIGPGDQLVISTLAVQLGISATPLREALRNLAAEGLVELQSHGSARVAEVDLGEATELYELRLALEPMALERSVARGDDAYRSRVKAAWESMTVARIATPSTHAAFHRELLSACDSRWLTRIATMLADRAGLMITAGFSAPPEGYDVGVTHRVLLEKVMAGDSSGAAAELSRHLEFTLTLFQTYLTNADPAEDRSY